MPPSYMRLKTSEQHRQETRPWKWTRLCLPPPPRRQKGAPIPPPSPQVGRDAICNLSGDSGPSPCGVRVLAADDTPPPPPTRWTWSWESARDRCDWHQKVCTRIFPAAKFKVDVSEDAEDGQTISVRRKTTKQTLVCRLGAPFLGGDPWVALYWHALFYDVTDALGDDPLVQTLRYAEGARAEALARREGSPLMRGRGRGRGVRRGGGRPAQATRWVKEFSEAKRARDNNAI